MTVLFSYFTKFFILFQKVVGYLCVIEYQKRGLPHAHILLTF